MTRPLPRPPATGCVEFLGERKGYCGKDEVARDQHDRPFCGLHSIDRKLRV